MVFSFSLYLTMLSQLRREEWDHNWTMDGKGCDRKQYTPRRAVENHTTSVRTTPSWTKIELADSWIRIERGNHAATTSGTKKLDLWFIALPHDANVESCICWQDPDEKNTRPKLSVYDYRALGKHEVSSGMKKIRLDFLQHWVQELPEMERRRKTSQL